MEKAVELLRVDLADLIKSCRHASAFADCYQVACMAVSNIVLKAQDTEMRHKPAAIQESAGNTVSNAQTFGLWLSGEADGAENVLLPGCLRVEVLIAAGHDAIKSKSMAGSPFDPSSKRRRTEPASHA